MTNHTKGKITIVWMGGENWYHISNLVQDCGISIALALLIWWTLRNKHQWNLNQNTKIFYEENVF